MLDLSIVIINWNTITLLEECLNSVINQTKKISYEIIVVDNGSTDKSVEMIKQKFPQIKLISNLKNIGWVFAGTNSQKYAPDPKNKSGWGTLIEKNNLKFIQSISLPTAWTFHESDETPYIFTTSYD